MRNYAVVLLCMGMAALMLSASASANINLTDCKTGNWSSGETYTLINDISKSFGSSQTCFNIDNNFITLNLNGYSIENSASFNGDLIVLMSNATQTTIANGSMKHANLAITVNSNNNNVANIYIDDMYRDIKLIASNNSIYSNITLNTPSSPACIWLTSESMNNTFNDILFKNSILVFKFATNSNNNIINRSAYYTTRAYTFIELTGSKNNIIANVNILGDAEHNMLSLSSASTNNTFINATYNKNQEYISGGSRLLRQWYYSAYVTKFNNITVSGAHVTGYNSTGALMFDLISNSGYTVTGIVTEYINSVYQQNYTINVTKPGYASQVKSWNFTVKQNIFNDYFNITLTATPPTINITEPKNGFVYNSLSVPLIVSANKAVSAWVYSLNGAANMTFTSNGTITAAQGNNNLTVCANETEADLWGCNTVYFSVILFDSANSFCLNDNILYERVAVAANNGSLIMNDKYTACDYGCANATLWNGGAPGCKEAPFIQYIEIIIIVILIAVFAAWCFK